MSERSLVAKSHCVQLNFIVFVLLIIYLNYVELSLSPDNISIVERVRGRVEGNVSCDYCGRLGQFLRQCLLIAPRVIGLPHCEQGTRTLCQVKIFCLFLS